MVSSYWRCLRSNRRQKHNAMNMSPFWKKFFSHSGVSAGTESRGELRDELDDLVIELAGMDGESRTQLLNELLELGLASDSHPELRFVFDYLAGNWGKWFSKDAFVRIEEIVRDPHYRRKWKRAADQGSLSEGWQEAVSWWSILARNRHPETDHLWEELRMLSPGSHMDRNLLAMKRALTLK